jgi:HSP20 family protein
METPHTESELPVREKHVTSQPGTFEGPHFEPEVDIYETEDALVLSADLPGVSAEDITTDVRDSLLTLTARAKPVDAKWKPLFREYAVGNYTRQFRLGQQIDQSRITAQLKEGVLTLTLPKSERVRPRRIEIKAG